jgi:hypothetical protein
MKPNCLSTQYDDNSQTVSTKARLLMSEHRQKVRNRDQSMLLRAASEVGIGI